MQWSMTESAGRVSTSLETQERIASICLDSFFARILIEAGSNAHLVALLFTKDRRRCLLALTDTIGREAV